MRLFYTPVGLVLSNAYVTGVQYLDVVGKAAGPA